MSAGCSASHRPRAIFIVVPRSDEKAIHRPSGDHDGRKSPPIPVAVVVVVTAFACRERRSIVQMRA